MSRKSSLASQNSMKLDQEMRECRMAYLSVLSSTNESMTSSKELTLALQYSGRNPTQKSINRYWKHSKESISYSEFCQIMKQEKQNSKNDLVSAFKKMDINNDGFISFSELKTALTMYGEKMSESEVQEILDEADDNGDGRLDYDEFCDLLMSTSEKCKELSQKKLKDDATSRERRSSSLLKKSSSNNDNGTFRSKPSKSPRTTGRAVKEPKSLKDWNIQAQKGFVVVEDDGKFSSHCYQLKVPSSTKLWLTIHGNFQDRQIDFTLFITKVDSGELVAFTQAVVDEKNCVLTDISAGEYNVLVFTTGCQLATRSFESKRTIELIKTANGEIELTKRCRDALTEIFHHCDLDGNGYLSRHEFDVFQMRTSGESCDDDSWEVMVENFDTKNGREITLKGFLDLNLMEARDAEGDPNDLWITFNSMGYNKALEPDQVAFFVTEIHSRDCDIKLQALKIDENKEILHKAVIQSIFDNSTTRNVKRMRDLILHRYEDEQRVSLAVENKSRQAVMVRLNCNKSQNCVSHCGNLNCVIKVEARSTEIGHHLIAVDPSKPWSVSCEDSVED